MCDGSTFLILRLQWPTLDKSVRPLSGGWRCGMTRATFYIQGLRFTRGFFVFYLSPITISRVPEKMVASTWFFFFACEQSHIFLYKVTAREINPSTQAPSRDKWGRNIMIIKVVPIPYCNITSWFAIAMAEIRTRRILREKEDCKQSINFFKYTWSPGQSIDSGHDQYIWWP